MESILLTEDAEEMITEDGENILLEDSNGGVQDMTFATSFPSAHVSVGTIKIESGGFR